MGDDGPRIPDTSLSVGRQPGREVAWIALAGLAVASAIAFWVFSGTPRRSHRSTYDPLVGSLRADDRYIGSRVCADCHPGEYAYYTRSGHARTLRGGDASTLAAHLSGRSIEDVEKPGLAWSFMLKDGKFFAGRTEGERVETRNIDFVFGSGHHGATFVLLDEPGSTELEGIEHHISYFRAGDRLGITPGQRARERNPRMATWGAKLPASMTKECFGCHTTRISAKTENRIEFDSFIPNVSCERCHGPAREHVEAQRSGREAPPMPFSAGESSADEQMTFCGVCHRHPSVITPGDIRPDNPRIARFQPVGLMQSRCYTQSAGALSCVNCHDPHARTKSDPAHYEAVCLKCHAGSSTRQVECRVSPRTHCLNCHMPKLDAGLDIPFTDHWIRIRDAGSGAK